MGFYMYGVLYKTRTNFKTSQLDGVSLKTSKAVFVCLSLPLSVGGLRVLGIIYSVDYSG